MTTWWAAVCSAHKEFGSVIIVYTDGENVKLANCMTEITFKSATFLTDHWSCDLKLIHKDKDFEKLYSEGFVRVYPS